eukprot:g5174.t1
MSKRIQSIARMKPWYDYRINAILLVIKVQASARKFRCYRWYQHFRASTMLVQGQFKAWIAYRFFLTKRSSVPVIQRNVRWFFVQRLIREMKQKQMRWFGVLQSKATTISRCWRACVARAKLTKLKGATGALAEKRFQMALRIQRIWYAKNGFLSKFTLCCALRSKHEMEIAAKRREYFMIRFRTVIKLQCKLRARRKRREFLRQRLMLKSAIKLQRRWRGTGLDTAFKDFLRVRRAAVAIQKLTRGFLCEKKRMALRVQFWWYRWLVDRRRRVDHIRHNLWMKEHLAAVESEMKRHRSAVKLQTRYRRLYSRKVMVMWLASRTIGKIARGFFARNRVKRIHDVVRRRVARRYVRSLFAQFVPDVAPRIWWQRRKAAEKIQDMIQRFLFRCRVLFAAKREAAAKKIQSGWSSYKSRKIYKMFMNVVKERKRSLFLKVTSVNDALQLLEDLTKKVFHPFDALRGITLPAFLRRLGLLHVLDDLRNKNKGRAITTVDMLNALEVRDTSSARAAFDEIDTDGGGTLDKTEVGEMMKKTMGLRKLAEESPPLFEKKVNAYFAEMDPNGDGSVEFYEYIDWYKRNKLKFVGIDDHRDQTQLLLFWEGIRASEIWKAAKDEAGAEAAADEAAKEARFNWYAIATVEEAKILFTAKFPKSEVRANNFAESVGGKDVTIAAISYALERFKEPGEARNWAKEIIDWREKEETRKNEERRRLKYIEIARMACQQMLDLCEEGVRRSWDAGVPWKTWEPPQEVTYFKCLEDAQIQNLRYMKKPNFTQVGDEDEIKDWLEAHPQCKSISEWFPETKLAAEAYGKAIQIIQAYNKRANQLVLAAKNRIARLVLKMLAQRKRDREIKKEYLADLEKDKVREAWKKDQERIRRERVEYELSFIQRWHWSEVYDDRTGSLYYKQDKVNEGPFWTWIKANNGEFFSRKNLSVKQLFDEVDEDGSGELDRWEVGKLMKRLGMAKDMSMKKFNKKLDIFMGEMDPNGDGSIDYDEFKIWFKGYFKDWKKREFAPASGEMSWDRPIYTVQEYDHCQTIIRLVRGFLGRARARSRQKEVDEMNRVIRERKEWNDLEWKRSMCSLIRINVVDAVLPPSPAKQQLLDLEEAEKLSRSGSRRSRELLASRQSSRPTTQYSRPGTQYSQLSRPVCKLFDKAFRRAFKIIDEKKKVIWEKEESEKRRIEMAKRARIKAAEEKKAKAARKKAQAEKKKRRSGGKKSSKKGKGKGKGKGKKSEKSATGKKLPKGPGSKDVANDEAPKKKKKKLLSQSEQRKRDEEIKAKKREAEKLRKKKEARAMVEDLTIDILIHCLDNVFKEADALHSFIKGLANSMIKKGINEAVQKSIEEEERRDKEMIEECWRLGYVLHYNRATKKHRIQLEEKRPGEGKRTIWQNLRQRQIMWCEEDKEKDEPKEIANVDVNIEITWNCRYGYELVKDEERDVWYYWNFINGAVTWTHPHYTYEEDRAAAYLQRIYRASAGRRAFLMAIRNSGIDKTISEAIKLAATTAWYGFGFEGIDSKMWMCRIGLPHLTSLLKLDRDRRLKLSLDRGVRSVDLTLLKSFTLEQLEILGIEEKLDRERIFTVARDKKLELRCMALIKSEIASERWDLNEDGSDCIVVEVKDKKSGPLPLYRAMFPNHSLRSEAFAQAVLQSVPAISLGALEHHLNGMNDRPKLAQDLVTSRYANQGYSSSREKVLRALKIMHFALYRASIMLANMKIDKLKEAVLECLEATEHFAHPEVLANDVDTEEENEEEEEGGEEEEEEGEEKDKKGKKKKKRGKEEKEEEKSKEMMSDEELREYLEKQRMEEAELFRACQRLRRCCGLVMKWWNSAIYLQKSFRGHKLHLIWMNYIYTRYYAALAIQCRWRQIWAVERYYAEYAEYHATIQEVWDGDNEAYFYVNQETGETTWIRPTDQAIRPYGKWPHRSKIPKPKKAGAWYHRKGKKKKHKTRPHQRKELERALIILQKLTRGKLVRNNLHNVKMEWAARLVQRRYRYHFLRLEGAKLFRNKRNAYNVAVRKFSRARGSMKRVVNTLRQVETGKSNRVKVFEAVSSRWESGVDSKKDLLRMIKEELKKQKVPKDRHNTVAKNVMFDVMNAEKQKMIDEQSKDVADTEALKKRLRAQRK